MINDKSLVDYIMKYEEDELSDSDALDLFGYLIRTGKAWTLQGHYGRIAQRLIDNRYIDRQGNILIKI